jgi:ribosome biogenesis GTPase
VSARLPAVIVAAHGRHYVAEADGRLLQCVTRGKKTNVAVGDRVSVAMTSNDQAVIEKIEERDTLLYRSDQYRSKLLAANVTQLFIVVATEPGFADDLVSRSLVAAEAAGVEGAPHPQQDRRAGRLAAHARPRGRSTRGSAIRCMKSRRARSLKRRRRC